MPFASDRLYDDYLRRNMGKIVSKVKVREIIPHLACLTQSDREEIDAKRETTGNYNAMQLLLDCLKRRENWPDYFISALELCEHWSLASEIRAEYDSLLSPRTPVAPAVNAHPSHIPDPSPPKHPVQVSIQTPEVEGPLSHPDPQTVAISGEQNLTPVNTDVSGVTAPPQNPTAPSGPGLSGASSQVPASCDTSVPPSLPPASQTPTPGPAVSPPEPQMSPVNQPVQDSNPPAANAIQQPVENSDPTVNQVAASDRQAYPAQGSSAQQPSRLTRLMAGDDRTDSPAMSSLVEGLMCEDELLSKPGTLLSCNVPVHRLSENPNFMAPLPEEPYSGDSGRLQFSRSCQESPAPSGTIVASQNEPQEDQYDSIQQSLLRNQDVQVNVGHVSEDAPLPNYTGQPPRASNQQPSLVPVQEHSPPGLEAERAMPGPQRVQTAVFPYNLLENYYVPAAAIAGLSAIVMLWRLKN